MNSNKIVCDCCGYPTSHWCGYYCADTPILYGNCTGEQIATHNALRVWLCRECDSNILVEIFRERPRVEWQPLLDRARAGLRPDDGVMIEDVDLQDF